MACTQCLAMFYSSLDSPPTPRLRRFLCVCVLAANICLDYVDVFMFISPSSVLTDVVVKPSSLTDGFHHSVMCCLMFVPHPTVWVVGLICLQFRRRWLLAKMLLLSAMFWLQSASFKISVCHVYTQLYMIPVKEEKSASIDAINVTRSISVN